MTVEIREREELVPVQYRVKVCDGCGQDIPERNVDKPQPNFFAYVQRYPIKLGDGERVDFCSNACAVTYFSDQGDGE